MSAANRAQLKDIFLLHPFGIRGGTHLVPIRPSPSPLSSNFTVKVGNPYLGHIHPHPRPAPSHPGPTRVRVRIHIRDSTQNELSSQRRNVLYSIVPSSEYLGIPRLLTSASVHSKLTRYATWNSIAQHGRRTVQPTLSPSRSTNCIVPPSVTSTSMSFSSRPSEFTRNDLSSSRRSVLNFITPTPK